MVVRTTGTGRGNEPIGSRGVKKRKCSTCGELGHRRTRCPNPTKNVNNCSQDSHGMTLSQRQRRRKSSQTEQVFDGADANGKDSQPTTNPTQVELGAT
ncbi:hypothetical protein PIB30_041517 [Stylosanthes scabra]|uniref:CCHC-type domain-containing protein n=1 Tax=Stylosanthes scabra TaxID=79078 RepID=A0ABU6WF31_9FABA|nr:hypothetical protein [Stylosanthes scabra]